MRRGGKEANHTPPLAGSEAQGEAGERPQAAAAQVSDAAGVSGGRAGQQRLDWRARSARGDAGAPWLPTVGCVVVVGLMVVITELMGLMGS